MADWDDVFRLLNRLADLGDSSVLQEAAQEALSEQSNQYSTANPPLPQPLGSSSTDRIGVSAYVSHSRSGAHSGLKRGAAYAEADEGWNTWGDSQRAADWPPDQGMQNAELEKVMEAVGAALEQLLSER